MALPGTPEELRRQCGVVAVEDDGFCGFWCLAYLLGVNLAGALQEVLRELATARLVAAEARAAGRRPSAEARAWERLWNIADAKLRCMRLSIRGSHVDAVGEELRYRGLEDSNVFLTHSELALLCERLVGWTPVVEVTPDFHGSEEIGDHTMLALAAAGYRSDEGTLLVPPEAIDDAEQLRLAGLQLFEQGFRLITAEPVSEGRPPETPRPNLAFLRSRRPLVIHLGTHYFILAAVDETAQLPLQMEEARGMTAAGACQQCVRSISQCLERWVWHSAREQNFYASNEARTPLQSC